MTVMVSEWYYMEFMSRFNFEEATKISLTHETVLHSVGTIFQFE